MRIAWFGLGQLGMPCALALAATGGHRVRGYDPAAAVRDRWDRLDWPTEPGLDRLAVETYGRFTFETDPADACAEAEAVFVCVATPHADGYDGSVPMPDERRPFDTSILVSAVTQTHKMAAPAVPIVVVSTVLPGTCRDELEPLLDGRPLLYSPAFVAMGSVVADLAHPEFLLVGARDQDRDRADALAVGVWGHVEAPLFVTSVESAELAKLAYNTAIGSKIVLANAFMEIAVQVGADADEVSSILESATDRVASGRYLRGGMGDGGQCHPRDQIAMSWLAERYGLSADPFEFVVRARERQAAWLAARLVRHAIDRSLPVVICGRAYKEGTTIEAGSASLLVAHYVEASGLSVDCTDDPPAEPTEAAVYLAARMDRTPKRFPPGSVVVDPWGCVGPQQPGVTVERIGRP